MFNHPISIVFRSIACGILCIVAIKVAAQETLELPFPAGPDGITQLQVGSVPRSNDGDLETDEYETLTRGPLHEAFAEPIVADPVPGLVVAQEPPAPINELAPEYRPDGEYAIWISGYWGWDEQREDFIWISGVYRVPPEGHQWVPGYWHSVSEGWQWVQGFWVEEAVESIAYLPPPPATLEVGPSSPSPGIDYFYVPGNWSQSNSLITSSPLSSPYSSGYLWNAGFWHPMQNDLVWIPAHVVWTPRGCVYVNGYWDQRLPMRGLCFAPVAIPRVIYSRPGWSLRPNVVLNSQVVLHNLFVQPRYNHYLFGDYYGLPPSRRDVVPAYVYHQSRGSCDPLISFYSAYNARQGQDLIRWYGNQHAELSRNPSLRPPQHWSPIQTKANDKTLRPDREPVQMAHTLDQVNKLAGGLQIVPVPESFKQNIMKADVDRKRLARERQATEGKVNLLGSVPTVGNTLPTLSLPKLESNKRKDDLSSKELPIRPQRDVNSLRIEPNKMVQGIGRADVPLRNPVPRNPEANRQTKPLHDTRDIDLAKRFEQPTRIESNRISNPLDTNRILEQAKKAVPKIDAPKILSQPTNIHSRLPNIQSQLPNTQPPLQNTQRRLPNVGSQLQNIPPPLPNRVIPSNESRPRSNQNPSSPGNVRGETRSMLPAQQIGSPNLLTQPRTQPHIQPPQGNFESNRRGNADKNGSSKKPK